MAGYHPKKRLGQHFLIDQATLSKTAALALEDSPDQIVEIGPGQGALTERLLESEAFITAVEFDREMLAYLTRKFIDADRLKIVAGDFLQFDPSEHALDHFRLAGNIPYNITSPVIDWCVTHRDRIDRAILMVQKELADRIGSEPGTKDWSPIALFTQLHFETKVEFSVAPEAFDPPPRVWSAVLTLNRVETPDIPDYVKLEQVVRAAFKQRRKTLVNNLVPHLVTDQLALTGILEQIELPTNCRAEQITTNQFLRLTEQLSAHKLI